MSNLFDAFISYGRADSKTFATKLHNKLVEQNLKVWFDQNDIPLGVDYQNQIDDGIDKAHNFLFIIAPHSVNSPYCLKEIKRAIGRNKRIIPLLHVEQISQETWQQRNPDGTAEDWETYKQKGLHDHFQNMHSTIRKINWVYFREGIDDFEESLAGLIELFKHHADYVEQHTRLLAKALEWEQHQKQTSCLLLGEEKQQAEAWLKIRFKNEQPPCTPSDLHCEFITESIKNANNLMTQVFISYADADKATMEKIRNSLRRESITVWTNKTDIQTGEAFEEAINRGIEQADNVVYLLSPDSVNSDFCQRELEYALSLHKRIIPVWVRATDLMLMPPALRHLQYIDLTDNVKEEDYLLDESQLLKILHQDAPYYNEHKVLLTKALKWKQQHDNPSILLRGYNLRSAETWLKVAKQRTQHPPTLLQEEFLTESLRQPPAESLDVFISYSRADSDFARKLNDSLQMQGKTTWFDQESIASGTDFQQEIYQGIKACGNFLFIISSRSVNSPYCADEVEYAAGLNKRLITVLHREINSTDLHPELAKVQWINFNQNQRDFNANFNQLVRTLDTDREHVQSHTKWLQRAIEWNEKNQSTDLLFRGSEFLLAESWLKEAQKQQKQPCPTDLQKAFIEASQNAIIAAEEDEKHRQAQMLRLQQERTQEAEARLVLQKKSAKKQRLLLVAVSTALVAAVGVSMLAFKQWKRAETVQESQINSVSRFSLVLSDSNRKFEALIEAIRAERQLQKQFNPVNSVNQSLVLTALQAAVYSNGFKERNQLVGHDYAVLSVSFSPDGKTIASSSGDNTAKLWSLDGKEIRTLRGHQNQIERVVWSPDGQTIATASWDKTIKLWSLDGKVLKTFEGHSKPVYSVAWSPDGKTIASASEDNTAIIWSLDGKKLKTLNHNNIVNSVNFSPDSKTIATGSEDGTIKLWSLDGKPIRTIPAHKESIQSVNWSPDGKTIASASADTTVKLWNLDGKLIHTLKGHNDWVKSVSFSPDSAAVATLGASGKTIATASCDNTVILWSRDQGIRQLTLKGHNNWVSSVSFSPNGKMIASASWDNSVKLWSIEGKKLKTLKGHNKQVNSVSFSPDGEMIASASTDKTVKLWSIEGKELKTLKGHIDNVNSVSFSPDSAAVATLGASGKTIASAGEDNTVILWNSEGKKPKILKGHKKPVNSVSFNPDGKMIASASSDNNVILWSIEGKLLKTLKGHKKQVNSVSFSPNGKMIASASHDNTVILWSSEGKLLKTLKGHIARVYGVVFSPDGKTIASASADKTVKLWNSEGKLLKTLKGHIARVNGVVFSPNGKTIASASTDKTVKLWSIEGKELSTLKGHTDGVNSVSFSPDRKTLASASTDGTVILWNLEDLQLNQLMQDACDWLRDYLKYNSQVKESDRHLCDGIK